MSFLALAFVTSWVAEGPVRSEATNAPMVDTGETVYLGSEGVVLQSRQNDCGLIALMMILDSRGIATLPTKTTHEARLARRGASLTQLKEIAKAYGVSADGWRVNFEELANLPMPAILFVDNHHFIVVDSVDKMDRVFARDPAVGRIRIPGSILTKRWRGEVLVLIGGGRTIDTMKDKSMKECLGQKERTNEQ
jgi:ABC-type bacteriocin/lantibiotic exporter with double-glycine peptidase domain